MNAIDPLDTAPVPAVFAPGVYFGLDADAYHADPALGSTNLKQLLASGPDFWWHSAMNPARPEQERDTPSLRFGRAVHAMVLEGRAAFDRGYGRYPEGDDLLVTDADMVAWLDARPEIVAALGEKVPRTKAGKAELIARLDPAARILDFLVAGAEADGIELIAGDAYDRIVTAGTMITANPALAAAFSGGVCEEGAEPVRLKCRFDYLKVRAISDLKSIRNVSGIAFPQACRRQIATYRYDVQAAHYMAGRAALPGLVAAGAVFGDHDPEWLARVAASEETAFVFVFYQATDAPITWATQLSPGNPILDIGRASADLAIHTYRTFVKAFGRERAWVLTEPISELDVSELPAWYGR
jgi:hypothetical protein